MANVSGVVQEISAKDRNTRFGTKKAYSAKVNGDWYSFAFKKPPFNVGDAVTFEYSTGAYGNDADSSTVEVKRGTPAVAGSPTASVTDTAPRQTSSKGVFPIPPLDGQRAIVRQNALTNARELVSVAVNLNYRDNKMLLDIEHLDAITKCVIRVARQFEAYSCGDLDVEEVEKEVEAELKKAA